MNLQMESEDYITVVPYYPDRGFLPEDRLVVKRLFFWHNRSFDHAVTQENLKFFLFHVRLYGATIYPLSPELGCSAVNLEPDYKMGETLVAQIYYRGMVIYCRS